MSRIQTRRLDYVHFARFETRWKDNDIYGHLNNVEYYSAFDTVINQHLIAAGGLDLHGGEIIGLCVESQCRFHDSFSFPETIEAGLRVGHLGRTSARYELGLFKVGCDVPAAEGTSSTCSSTVRAVARVRRTMPSGRCSKPCVHRSHDHHPCRGTARDGLAGPLCAVEAVGHRDPESGPAR